MYKYLYNLLTVIYILLIRPIIVLYINSSDLYNASKTEQYVAKRATEKLNQIINKRSKTKILFDIDMNTFNKLPFTS